MVRFSIVLILAALLAPSAHAAVVTVSPDNMQGWDAVVNRFGLAYFTSGGVVWGETGAGFPSGRGAFYALTQGGGVSTSDKTPDTVWIGLDTFNGQPLAGITLNQIRTLRYTAYVSDMPSYQVIEGQWKYPRQPITLQFIITDGTTFTRNLWFRPWSNAPEGHGYGGNPADQLGQWITYDCINCTPQFSGPSATIIPQWSEPEGNQSFHSWAEVCAVYGSAYLVATSTTFDPANGQFKSPGWDNGTTPAGRSISTGTGMPLNFEVGARKFAHSNIWSDQGTNTSWFPESVNFKGYLDTFTLGIDLNADGDDADEGEQTEYDFEPVASAQVPKSVALNLRSILEGVANPDGSTGPRTGYAAIWESSGLWKIARPRLFGTVLPSPAVSQVEEGIYSENGNSVLSTQFTISDGTQGIPVPFTVRVRDADGTLFSRLMWSGDYVGISGDVRRKPWGNIKMRYLWSCAENLDIFTELPQ